MIELEESKELKMPKKGEIWSLVYGKKMAISNGVYCNYASGKIIEEFSCPFDDSHSTSVICKNLEAELFGGISGKYKDPFIPMANHGFDLIEKKVIESYLEAGLKGLLFNSKIHAFSHVGTKTVKWDYSTYQVIGSAGIRNRIVKNGTELKCLKCKRTPVTCPGCGVLNEFCIICKAKMVEFQPTKKNVYYFKGCPESIIIDAKNWDGTDFFGIKGTCSLSLVTNKARRWLEKIAPDFWGFQPAILEMAGA